MTSARDSMIDSQLRTNKVTDPAVLDALAATPREDFVPEAFKGTAYVDEDIKVSNSRYLMEPMVLARMIEAASLSPADSALVVGSSTGFTVSLLSQICASAVGLESDEALVEQARAKAAELEHFNASFMTGDVTSATSLNGPFSFAIVDGAVPDASAISNAFEKVMSSDARIVVVERSNTMVPGQAVLLQRDTNGWNKRTLFDASVPVLPEYKSEPGFSF